MITTVRTDFTSYNFNIKKIQNISKIHFKFLFDFFVAFEMNIFSRKVIKINLKKINI